MASGFPELSDSFLAGQDILYGQFNDISFFIEDTEQEVLYYNILKNIFPDINLNKIFPLNGKTNVISNCQSNQGNKKKVYIVDDDFDSILNQRVTLDSLFYLNGYSIENFLISKNGLFEIIRFYNPKLKDHDIQNLVNYNNLLKSSAESLKELALCFLVIQKHSLGLSYYQINTNRDFDFTSSKPYYRQNHIQGYIHGVEQKLKQKDSRYTLNAKIKEFKSHFRSLSNSILRLPGKYLLEVLKDRLVRMGLIKPISLGSFTYFLAKENKGDSLISLKLEIENYIK